MTRDGFEEVGVGQRRSKHILSPPDPLFTSAFDVLGVLGRVEEGMRKGRKGADRIGLES
jgi:hypothetical protein